MFMDNGTTQSNKLSGYTKKLGLNGNSASRVCFKKKKSLNNEWFCVFIRVHLCTSVAKAFNLCWPLINTEFTDNGMTIMPDNTFAELLHKDTSFRERFLPNKAFSFKFHLC